jgi:cell division protein FtsI/penicillin-binding protein 2
MSNGNAFKPTITRRLRRDRRSMLRQIWNNRPKWGQISATGIPLWGVCGSLVCVMVIALVGMCQNPAQRLDASQTEAKPPAPQLSKTDVKALLAQQSWTNLTQGNLDLAADTNRYWVDTSLVMPLHEYLLPKLDRKNAREIGILALEPATGRILAMISYNKDTPSDNPCLQNHFPAASIFKIVTAAAAIEKLGYTADSVLTFNGMKHTLYKSQLRDRRNKYTNRISLKNAFAQSVNPVFGKIGRLHLGQAALAEFGHAFGFNQPIQFETAVDPSYLDISDKPYHWAEIASGFNRETLISPLHGALIAATIVNGGTMVEPSLVDQITDRDGHTVYRQQPRHMRQVIKPETARHLRMLMHKTVSAGTSRKAFRGYRRDVTLSKLDLGGKTGSIYNRSHDKRYDWFVGYAAQKKGPAQIAVAVMVAHDKYIGIRASRYARMTFKQYFLKGLPSTDP